MKQHVVWSLAIITATYVVREILYALLSGQNSFCCGGPASAANPYRDMVDVSVIVVGIVVLVVVNVVLSLRRTR